jgi:broad specificity phosphatase PhoE
MARTQLYLVRHGEQDQASGHSDGGLSQAGRDQADRLGRRLSTVPFSVIHYSAAARAAQTAGIVAGHLPQVPKARLRPNSGPDAGTLHRTTGPVPAAVAGLARWRTRRGA